MAEGTFEGTVGGGVADDGRSRPPLTEIDLATNDLTTNIVHLDAHLGHLGVPGLEPSPVDLPARQASAAPLVPAQPVESAEPPTVEFTRAPRAGTPRWVRRHIAILVAIDMLAALIAGGAAYSIRFDTHLQRSGYLAFTFAMPLLFAITSFLYRAYEPRYVASGSDQFRRVASAGVFLTAAVAVVSFAFKLEVARGYVVISLPLATILAMLGRIEARQVLHRLRQQGRCLHRVVVIGTERSVAELVRQVRSEPTAGLAVVGACIDGARGRTVESVPVVGGAYDGVAAVRALEADTLAVTAWSYLSQQELREMAWQLERSNVDLLVAPRLTGVSGPRISIRGVGALPLLHVEQPKFTGVHRLIKAVFDRSAALGLFLLTSPLFLGLALAVRLTSPGPALFKQRRVGANGETFMMVKFRTMVVDAEARLESLLAQNKHQDGPLFKIDNDPRITRIGAWLRKFSLDELPQLLNVIRGDMSLVGPRPPLPREVELYASDAQRRLLVKPGITGMWQVSGRSDLSWEESVRLDLHYVENWSLATDITILWKTLFAVLERKGAY